MASITNWLLVISLSTLIVGIDMEKNGDRNFLRLNTHLKISFS